MLLFYNIVRKLTSRVIMVESVLKLQIFTWQLLLCLHAILLHFLFSHLPSILLLSTICYFLRPFRFLVFTIAAIPSIDMQSLLIQCPSQFRFLIPITFNFVSPHRLFSTHLHSFLSFSLFSNNFSIQVVT